ncbi:MAG: Nif3-like dinuclear metal center hexameric protein [Solidesulfovibrio sp. DCME]|uniref:Nif3-like dinuclear metal center hexameric protein n=1 Tax=Solidesulfovibrio sp. DCME TaxID=3447380 RepID=UPI003D1500EF
MRVNALLAVIEATADPGRAASWDRSGVQVAGTAADCDKLAVALDPSPELARQALAWGAQVILTHHPVGLTPRLPDRLDDFHRLLTLVLSRGAWLYAAHTSLDTAMDGPPAWLAEALELTGRRILEPAGRTPYLAARWRAASPPSGRAALGGLTGVSVMLLGNDLLEVVFPRRLTARVRAMVATACPDARLVCQSVLDEPAEAYGYGLVGTLPAPLSLDALLDRLAALLPRRFFLLAGSKPETVSRVAYCPGSGADMAGRAFAAGAEAYLTGDLKYHQALEVPAGRCVVDVGHFSLEEVMMRRFAESLAAELGPDGPAVRYFPGNDPFSAHVPGGALPRRTE